MTRKTIYSQRCSTTDKLNGTELLLVEDLRSLGSSVTLSEASIYFVCDFHLYRVSLVDNARCIDQILGKRNQESRLWDGTAAPCDLF